MMYQMATEKMCLNRVFIAIGIFAMIMTSATMARTFDEQTQPNLMTTSTPTPVTPTAISSEPQFNSTCFYAEPELCTQFNENEPCKECMPHPVFSNSLVCCNVTDIEKLISCMQNPSGDNSTFWTHIHIRNATLEELDISHRFWRRLDSLAITDGQVKRIVREFPKLSPPKCLNMSNNNIVMIPTRALKDLTRLQVLDLSHNNLSTMPNLPSHANLTLDIRGNNGMLCKPVQESIERGVIFVEPDSTFCLTNQTFNWFNSTDSIPLRQLELMKQLHSECPHFPGYGNCTCEPQRMTYEAIEDGQQLVFAAKVDCSNLGLTSLPKTLPINTLSLNVSNNSITSLSDMTDNLSYQHLLRLYADDNKIESFLDLEGTDFIQNFDTLHLRRNKLKTIPYYLLSNSLDRNPEGRILYLEGNPIFCDCNSAKILKIWLLARQNHIPDSDKVMCANMPKRVLDLSETKLCQSPHDWTDYIYYLIAAEVFLLLAIITKVSYDYYVFKTAGYLPWPASRMPKLPCDWLCET